MFKFFKKKRTIEIPVLGTFEIFKETGGFNISANYNSRFMGRIKISFPTKTEEVSSHQLETWQNIEKNWDKYKKSIPLGFKPVDVLIPEFKSLAYDEIDAEIVLMNKQENIKSIILKNKEIDEIIDIE